MPLSPEAHQDLREDTLIEIEQVTAFIEGRGPFPVAGFVGLEDMSQAEIRERAAVYLRGKHPRKAARLSAYARSCKRL